MQADIINHSRPAYNKRQPSISTALLAILLGAFSMYLAIPASPLHAAEPSITTLPNGFTILVQQDERFPLASLRLYVRAGSAYETKGQEGISHLLEHMVFKGTHNRAMGETAKEVESAGGSLNAATSFDYTVFLTDMPADKWQLGMDVLHDMIFNATIDPDELEREKKVVLSELARNEDTPGNMLFKSMQPLTWPGTPYEAPIIGFRDTVSNISRQDILDYIHDHYQPQSMLLVVCGNVDPAQVQAEASKLFGNLSNDRQLHPAELVDVAAIREKQGATPRVKVIGGEYNKVYLNITFPLPGFPTAGTAALETLGQILGGDKTSRFYRTFKYDKQLVDDISTAAMTLQRSGAMYINVTLDADKLDQFWTEFAAYLSKLDPAAFTDEEVERAKLNLEDSMYQAKETLAGLASKIGFFQFFENGAISEQNYLFELSQVDKASLKDAFEKYIQPGAFSSVVLAPENQAATLEKDLTDKIAKAWPAKTQEHTAKADAGAASNTEVLDIAPGRKLVLMPDTTLPYTSVSLAIRGGDSLLTPKQQGLAALSARTLTKGTTKRSASELQDYLSDRAASLDASAMREALTVNAKFPSRFSNEILPLFKEVLTQPGFADTEVAREKQNQIAGIKGREDQPLGLAFRNVFPFLFTDTNYSYFHLGTIEGVEAFTPEDVKTYWQNQKGNGWVLAVCGDFDRDAIIELAKSLAAEIGPQKDDAKAFATPKWSDTKSLNLHLEDRNQTHLLEIWEIPPVANEDTAGLKLLREVLAGQSGLLFNRLRDEQGLGYSVTAFNWQSPAAGFMAFYIGTSPDKKEQALEGFDEVLAELRDKPLDEAAIQRGRNLLQGDYYREHQSLDSRSREASSLLIQGLPLDINEKDIQKAKTITAEELQALARKYLNPGKSYLLSVSP